MLKKLFYRLIILSLIGMLVSPFILKKENGTAIMSKDDFFSFDSELIKSKYVIAMAKIKRILKKKSNMTDSPGTLAPEYTKLYKWKDEKGEWHFSDAPAENYNNEEIKININRNVLNFGELPSEGAGSDEDKSTTSRGEGLNSSSGSGKKGYFDRMTSAVEDANNVQSQVDNDIKRKEDAINSY